MQKEHVNIESCIAMWILCSWKDCPIASTKRLLHRGLQVRTWPVTRFMIVMSIKILWQNDDDQPKF